MNKHKLLKLGAILAESHPYLWKLAWATFHYFPFILPHDKSYAALKHFIALRPKEMFLDIGANDGISVLSFRRFDQDYEILSLEPNPLLEPALAKIGHKDPLFQYRILGAGSHQDRLTFFVPVYRGVVLHTFTSSNREQVLDAIKSSFGKNVALKIRIERVECDVVPIDHLEVNPSIIKIDAEGLDYEVLLGASETISRTRPFVVVEVGWASIDKVAAFFRDRDYSPLFYDPGADLFRRDIAGYIKAESGYRNLFAVPNESIANLPIESD